MKIKEMPWFTRPGTRLRRDGVSALSDAELLAIIIGRGDKYENAVDMSNRLLRRYNFNKLASFSLQELEAELRNSVKAMRLLALFELSRRINRLLNHGFATQIQSAEDVYHYFSDVLSFKKKEYFYVLFLDTKNRIISYELVSVGTLNASLIHPREVFRGAITSCANSVILVHNHPSGDCEPSLHDKKVTGTLVEAGRIIGIDVLDHVIIGSGRYLSFKEKGLL
jgi:DNA repair protein RadC